MWILILVLMLLSSLFGVLKHVLFLSAGVLILSMFFIGVKNKKANMTLLVLTITILMTLIFDNEIVRVILSGIMIFLLYSLIMKVIKRPNY